MAGFWILRDRGIEFVWLRVLQAANENPLRSCYIQLENIHQSYWSAIWTLQRKRTSAALPWFRIMTIADSVTPARASAHQSELLRSSFFVSLPFDPTYFTFCLVGPNVL